MTQVGIWNVSNGTPERLQRGVVDLERQLEEWIQIDPTLIQHGLVIVGRQVQLDSGRLDLLGLDPLGNWVIVEIKRGNVRRETALQALDYAASIQDLPAVQLAAIVENYLNEQGETLNGLLSRYGLKKTIFDERNLIIFVVGTGRDSNMERLTRFLADRGIPINVVNIDAFENDGQRFLLRQLTELELTTHDQKKANPAPGSDPEAPAKNQQEIDRLLDMASKNGIGESFREIYDAAVRCGLYPRTYKRSIMYTPPQNKSRVLICVWVNPIRGLLNIYIGSNIFAEFFPVSEQEVVKSLGVQQNYHFNAEQVETFVANLTNLFARIAENS